MKISLYTKRLVLMLSIAGASLQAVVVQLPGSKELTERIVEIMPLDFLEKTNLIEELAGQKEDAEGVAAAVELALMDYVRCSRKSANMRDIQRNKNLLVEAILRGYPEAIEELQSLGVLR